MEKLKEYKHFFIILVLFLINLFLFNNKMINVHTDFGREILFSKMAAQGAVLYKDIFNTFVCPFSYLFNGFVLKFVPVHLDTFYLLGAINTAVILGCIYFISSKFLNKFVSSVITVFVMYYCCFYAGLMNFLTPYSYAIVYGLSACLVSIVAYLRFLETDKNKFLYAAFFFGGLAACCKYEFLMYCVLLFAFFFVKKPAIKQILFSFAMFLAVPVLCAAVLLMQGLKLSDLADYFVILKDFLHQPYLKKVYAITCFLSKASVISALKTFAGAGIIFALLYKFYEKKSVIFRVTGWLLWLILAGSALLYFPLMEYFTYSFWGFITYLVVVLSIIKAKDLIKNSSDLFLVLSSLVISLKSFWFLSANFYGRYFLPLLIVALCMLLKRYYFKENSLIFEKTFCAVLIFLSAAAFRLNLVSLVLKNNNLQTPYGNPAVTRTEKSVLQPIIEYINKNTKTSDKVVVLGNAPLVNFLTNRASIPLYSHYDEAIAGAYGSKRITDGYKKYKPEYIVIFNGEKNQKGYCDTYGNEVCRWVFQNYKPVKIINNAETVYILQKI